MGQGVGVVWQTVHGGGGGESVPLYTLHTERRMDIGEGTGASHRPLV